MLSDVDIDPGTTVIIKRQLFWSIQVIKKFFFHLQTISDDFDIIIIRIYGVAGHGKNEVDTVGGIAKIAIRTAISHGTPFFNADQCVDYLTPKFSIHEHPSYRLKLIEPDILEEERLKSKYINYQTIKGSSSFQVVIFEPNTNIMKAAQYLYGCNQCLSEKYGSCSLFYSYSLESGNINNVSLRSGYHQPVELNKDCDGDNDEGNQDISSLVCRGNICAIVADKASIDTVWFVFIVNGDCVSNNSSTDAYGHTVSALQHFITCNYLDRVATEKHNPNSRTFQDFPGHLSCFSRTLACFIPGLFQDF